MCYEYALSFVPSPKTLNDLWFMQQLGKHPALTDTSMTLWLRPAGGGGKGVAGDSANLSTLVGFAKKLAVSGQDALIRRGRVQTQRGSPGLPSLVSLLRD